MDLPAPQVRPRLRTLAGAPRGHGPLVDDHPDATPCRPRHRPANPEMISSWTGTQACWPTSTPRPASPPPPCATPKLPSTTPPAAAPSSAPAPGAAWPPHTPRPATSAPSGMPLTAAGPSWNTAGTTTLPPCTASPPNRSPPRPATPSSNSPPPTPPTPGACSPRRPPSSPPHRPRPHSGFPRSALLHGIHLAHAHLLARDPEATLLQLADRIPDVQSIHCRNLLRRIRRSAGVRMRAPDGARALTAVDRALSAS